MSISTVALSFYFLIKGVRHPTASQAPTWAPQQGGGAATTGAGPTGAGDSCTAGT